MYWSNLVQYYPERAEQLADIMTQYKRCTKVRDGLVFELLGNFALLVDPANGSNQFNDVTIKQYKCKLESQQYLALIK